MTDCPAPLVTTFMAWARDNAVPECRTVDSDGRDRRGGRAGAAKQVGRMRRLALDTVTGPHGSAAECALGEGMTVEAENGGSERHQRSVVLVTGGSRGIGLALACGFAARGHDILLVARDAENLRRAATVVAAHGARVDHIACDLSRPESIGILMAAIGESGFSIEVLVNCAGVGATGAFTSNKPDTIRETLRLNMDAATALMRACLPAMVKRGRGGVLNVASLAGMLPMPYVAVYAATKSYLVSLSRAVASELEDTGVVVSALLPGPVDTGFFSQATGEPYGELLPGLPANVVARIAIEGFAAGQTVITPGMMGWLCRIGVKLLPWRVPTAIVRRILRRSLTDDRQPSVTAPRKLARPAPARLRWMRGIPGHVLVLACLALTLAVQVGLATRKAPYVDSEPNSSVAIAANLLVHGVYADTFVLDGTGRPPPGRYLPPAYPLILAGLGALDADLAKALTCLAAKQGSCSRAQVFRPLIVLQALLAFAALVFVCVAALELSGSSEIAGLTTLLTFVMARPADFAGTIIPIGTVVPLALMIAPLLLLAHRRQSLVAATFAGLVTGVLALAETYYAAVIAIAPMLLVWAESRRDAPRWQFARTASLTLVLAPCLMLGPWLARNFVLFGDISPLAGVDTDYIAERMAYNGLSASEIFAGMFTWLPGIGDASNLLLPAQTVRKFEIYFPGSLLWGKSEILLRNPAAEGVSQFRRLLDVYAFGAPLEFAASTALLLVRGLRSTGGFLVLWGWFAVPVLLRRLAAQRQTALFMLLAGPPLAMVTLHSLFTANLPWLNVPLVFLYAYAIADVTGGLELPFGLRRGFAEQAPPNTTSLMPDSR